MLPKYASKHVSQLRTCFLPRVFSSSAAPNSNGDGMPKRVYTLPKKISRRVEQSLNQRRFALRLYRGILRAHQGMPYELKELGDRYVRAEFDQHREAEAQHLHGFFSQWLQYLTDLTEQLRLADAARAAQPDGLKGDGYVALGKSMDMDSIDMLSDEQAQQLLLLKDEVDDLFMIPEEKESSDAAAARNEEGKELHG